MTPPSGGKPFQRYEPPPDVEAHLYARVSRYRMKPESFDEALRMVDAMKPQIKAIPGIQDWLNMGRTADGEGVVIALYENEAAAEAALPRAREIWAQFADHLMAEPETEGYDVVMDLPSD